MKLRWSHIQEYDLVCVSHLCGSIGNRVELIFIRDYEVFDAASITEDHIRHSARRLILLIKTFDFKILLSLTTCPAAG